MTILNKALTRPAALWGVPLVPLLFTLCILTLAAVWSRFYWLLLLLIPAFIELRRLAKEDIHFFDLKLLAFKTRGNRAATRHFGTKALVANQYDAIDVTEFIKHMRLNESIPLSRYAIMHNKFMVIDGKNVQTGSFNYTASAVSRNAENVLLIEDAPQLAEAYQREFNRLWDEGIPLNALY